MPFTIDLTVTFCVQFSIRKEHLHSIKLAPLHTNQPGKEGESTRGEPNGTFLSRMIEHQTKRRKRRRLSQGQFRVEEGSPKQTDCIITCRTLLHRLWHEPDLKRTEQAGSAPIRLHSYAYALSLSMRWGRITEGKTIFLSSLYNHAPPPIKIEEFAPLLMCSVSDSQTIQPFSLLGEVCRCAQVTVQQQTTTKKRNTPFCARTVRCATVLVFFPNPFLVSV